MVKKYILVMDMWKFVIILVLYFSLYSCYPSKPLNERAPDLTWEAWLLVDDQNQNKQPSDGVLRRRITPKSVFIAPTFSPESLPACADGYSSDILGRCIKIIKLDEAAHYEFLIERLKEKFSNIDYDDDYEDEPQTTGPFQVNIPLGIQNDQSDEVIEESDVAIIVSPTKPQSFTEKSSVEKRDDVAEQKAQEALLKKLAEITTASIESTTESLSTLFTQITDIPTDATETLTTSAPEGSTGTETTLNSDWTTDTKQTTFSPKPEHFTAETNLVRFPDEPQINSRVRFPSDNSTEPSQIPPSAGATARAIDDSRQSDQPVVDLSLINLRDSTSRVTPQENSNRRNRDKNNGLFFLPPRWADSNYQRPVMLRFSRKHAYLDMDQFKKPDFYRSIPTDDFAYLFKFKHKQSDQR